MMVSQVFVEFLLTLILALGTAMAVYVAFPQIRKFIQARQIALAPCAADRLVLLLCAGYVCIFSTLAVLRHLAFNTFGFDVGVFDQTIWNSLRGRLFELSLVYDVPAFIAQHFSPILLTFVPLYAVWDSPNVLLIVQSLALAVTVFPIYWLARARLGHALAVVIATAFLLSPAIQFPNLIEFHEVVLATPLLAFAAFFLLRRNDKAFLVCIVLSLMIKEEIGLTASFFGIYIAVVQKRWRFGLTLAASGIAWVALLLQFVLPLLRGGGTYYFFGGGFAAGHAHYDYLGESFSEVVLTLLTRPEVWLPQVLMPEKIAYVLHFLVPLAFLPLVGGEIVVMALPTLGLSLISTFPPQYSIASHYALPLVPFLFFATVLGAERILRRTAHADRPARQWALSALILVASSTTYLLQSPGPGAQHFEAREYQSAFDLRNKIAYDLMREIPDDAVLVAQRELVPHMTHRQQIWEFPFVPDYRQADYLFFDKARAGYFALAPLWREWFDSGYFETIKEQDGFVIARRRAPAQSLDIRYGDAMSLLGYTIITTDTLWGGQKLRPIVEWRAEQDIRTRYIFQIHVVDDRGHLWARDENEPAGGSFHTDRWKKDRRIGDQYTVRLPSTMPPDEYRIVVGVYDPESDRRLVAHDAAGRLLGDDPVIATIRIEKDKTSILASQLPIEQPLYVDMGEIRFIGYVPPRQTITAGEPFSLGLYWRARDKPRGDYVVAVQLRDVGGRVAFEHAGRPAHNVYPTTQWDAGEVLRDWHDFTLPSNLPAGDYAICVVLRDAASGRVLGEAHLAPLSVAR